MDVITQIAMSQFVWSILCIILAALVIREMRKENVKRENDLLGLYQQHAKQAEAREAALLEHLKESNNNQQEIGKTLKQIRNNLGSLEDRVEKMENHHYKRS
ncbi:hypothetical protein [Alkalicoccobacillus murimartini]|uniref:Flagellar motility protein MotE (MotC chaperone) n=1 Tax=Alkalicoccobacillus murimartini TaxID=171685 RepID=A0ABT9YFQ9_9BACI|nr:hypothetical protein [Alkalicoccobacillus murimartini]MDQ0206660.1 flagellar motility protein MotE (MotC chaperone) [Alkalicoccobacillus murimartini]